MPDGRYDRLEAIEWWDQQRISAARAVVVGVGALGNEVLKNLLLLGWGNLVLVDVDRVESSNLPRSVLFDEAAVGEAKVTAAARSAARLSPGCKVVPVEGDVRLGVGGGLVAAADVVFGCVDNVAARVAVAQLVGSAGVPFVDGGLTIWEGAVRVFGPGDGPCYLCGLSDDDLDDLNLRRSCLAYQRRAQQARGVPTAPTVASATAALMVQQAVRIVHGLPAAIGRELRIDLAHDRFWKVGLARREDCPLHPEVVKPIRRPGLTWDTSWDALFTMWRHDFDGRDVTVHLPVPLLTGWECPACGMERAVLRATTGDEEIYCDSCGSRAAARIELSLDAGLGTTPRGVGLPPLSWLTVYADGRADVFELDGGGPEWSGPVLARERR